MPGMDPSFVSTTLNPDNLIAGHKPPAKVMEIILTDGESVVRGEVLGRVTANDKFLSSLSAAVDGSELPRAIAAEDAAPSGADAKMHAFVEGEFNQDKLTIGTAHTIASIKHGLTDLNIYIVDPVTATPV